MENSEQLPDYFMLILKKGKLNTKNGKISWFSLEKKAYTIEITVGR